MIANKSRRLAIPVRLVNPVSRAIVLIGLFLLGSPLFAQTHLDAVLKRGEIRIGTTGDYKPFSYRPEGGQFVGLDVDLAADLAETLGVRLGLVQTSWPTLMKDLQADRFDMALSGISVSLERQKQALFSLPYLKDGKTPLTRCENKHKFETLAQIDKPGTRLVVNPGGTNESFVRSHLHLADITVSSDNVTIFDRIVSGEADLMITDAIEARLQQKLRSALCAIHPESPFNYSEKAALLPRDLLVKAYVDQWLHQSLASGALDRKLEKWLTYPWQLEPLRQLIDQRLSMMADVAKFKWNTRTPIEDLPREALIVAGFTKQATDLGIDAGLASTFFKGQIEAAKTLQREYFAKWQSEGADQFSNVPDLAKEIRPKLDALTPRMLKALAEGQALLKDGSGRVLVKKLLPLSASTISALAAEQAISSMSPER
jgi:chorismate mutase-like protein